jgi:hypothetical protein
MIRHQLRGAATGLMVRAVLLSVARHIKQVVSSMEEADGQLQAACTEICGRARQGLAENRITKLQAWAWQDF